MHSVLHFIANVGLGAVVLSLVFMALSNLRIAVDCPWIVKGRRDWYELGGHMFPALYEYFTRQRSARRCCYGRAVQRECILANMVFVIGGLALWPDILLHLWYTVSKF